MKRMIVYASLFFNTDKLVAYLWDIFILNGVK